MGRNLNWALDPRQPKRVTRTKATEVPVQAQPVSKKVAKKQKTVSTNTETK